MDPQLVDVGANGTLGRVLAGACLLVCLAACEQPVVNLRELPQVADYCRSAQRFVAQTEVPVELVVHTDFNDFVKSKAIFDTDGQPVIQQFNWFDGEGRPTAVSCKLKSAEHLNLVFGPGSAGPEGLCQQMNQVVFKKIAKDARNPVFSRVTFDPVETVSNEEQPGMTGPDWLAPFPMLYVKDDVLHVAAKGFVVEFTDPRYAEAPERFRGVHYCHFVAPPYLEDVMAGRVPPEVMVGREVDRSGPPPAQH